MSALFQLQGSVGRARCSLSPARSHEQLTASLRAGVLQLPHGPVQTPVFMPVGTKGSIKGLSSQQLLDDPALAPEIILGNTYHLGSQPGTQLLSELGGLHGFMNWPRNLLTDSGGFQMVSLLQLAEITEVKHFDSPFPV